MKLLIPLAYLNEACFLSLNTDEKKFKMALKLAQDQLRAILGAEFYAEIETQYNPQGDTLTSANATLYEDYIKDYLAWETYLFYIAFAQADDTPTGIRQFNDENSEIISDIKLSARERNVEKQAIFYRDQMITFLRQSQTNDSTSYSLWEYQCNDTMSWGISGVAAKSDRVFKINKATLTNE